jgi:Tfp pilus assembly protein PilF
MSAAALLVLCLSTSLLAQGTLVDQGRAALMREEPERAADLLQRAVAQDPNNAEAHYLLGDAYGNLAQKASIFKQLGLAGKTRDEFERAVHLDPNHVQARFALVQYYTMAPGFLGGDDRKALAQAEEIRKRDPILGHRAAAFIDQHQRKPELARKELLDAVKEQPASPRAHYFLGSFYLTTDKNMKAATEEFEAAVKADPNYMPGWFEVGHMAALTGANQSRGEESLRKYLTYTPKSDDDPPLARAHYWLGMIFEKQGKKSDARQSYMTSLRLDPNQKDVAEALKRVS